MHGRQVREYLNVRGSRAFWGGQGRYYGASRWPRACWEGKGGVTERVNVTSLGFVEKRVREGKGAVEGRGPVSRAVRMWRVLGLQDWVFVGDIKGREGGGGERGRGQGLQTLATGVLYFDGICVMLALTGGGRGECLTCGYECGSLAGIERRGHCIVFHLPYSSVGERTYVSLAELSEREFVWSLILG